LQKRSSIPPARYLLALLAALVGCGGGGPNDGPIPVDSRPIPADAYKKPLGAAVEVAHARDDDAYRERLITVFTSVTAENAMKWDRIEPERGRFDFREADELARFAKRTGKRLRGHPLVFDLQLPSWLTDRDWTAPQLRAVLRRHIRTIVRRYRGRVAEWDVVNEPLADDGRFERNLFYRVLGPGYVPFALRVAHRADPHARLFVNEIDAERGRKSAALFVLARGLVRQGVPIDALGFQNHTTGRDAVSPRRLRQLFRGARRLGLDAAITEMDVGATEERPQARVYREAARACAHAPNCTGLTVWGITDRFSWLTEDAHPLPFEADGTAKPAFDALVRPLRRR
jgi:endo-1,4-beta-xylanase